MKRRRRRTYRALIYGGVLSAPWSAAIVGSGVLRFRLADVLLGLALVAAVVQVRRRGALPATSWARRQRKLLLGIALLTGGVLAGTAIGAGGDYLLLTGFGVAAAVPTILLLRARADVEMIDRLARLFVAGTVISVIAALALGYRNYSGSAIGFTLHRNQLGMTIAMSLPLVHLLPHRWLRVGTWGLLLYGANETGSRSTLLGVAVVLALMLACWARAHPSRVTIVAALVVLAVPLALVANGIEGGEQTTLGRLSGSESARFSDEERRGAIASGYAELDLGTTTLGGGYYLDPPPHTMVIETVIAGGVIAGLGLAMVLLQATRALSRVLVRGWQATTATRCSIAVAGWFTIVSLNNILWVPYVWVMIALAVYAPMSPRARRKSMTALTRSAS